MKVTRSKLNPFTVSGSIHSIRNAVHHATRSLTRFLTAGSDVEITTSCDRNGLTIWKIYDPTTRTIVDMTSEEEVYCWID